MQEFSVWHCLFGTNFQSNDLTLYDGQEFNFLRMICLGFFLNIFKQNMSISVNINSVSREY